MPKRSELKTNSEVLIPKMKKKFINRDRYSLFKADKGISTVIINKKKGIRESDTAKGQTGRLPLNTPILGDT